MPVRYAILGFGHHAAKRLVPSFAGSEASALVGLWRRDAAAAAQNCREFDVPHCFGSREELCASPEVDAVFVTSPDAMHRDDVLLALRHGKAVLCEKPLAMQATEAEQMVAAAERAGVVFGVAQNFRWNASLIWLRDAIAAGRIGEPQMAHAQFSYRGDRSPRRWITDPMLACGGPLGDVGVHCMDALRFALRQEVTAIEALAQSDALSGEVEAWATMQLRMSGGVLAMVSVSARAAYRTLVEVTGSEGAIVMESGLTVDRPVTGVVLVGGDEVERRSFLNADAYTRMLDSFSAAVREGSTFAATGRDGLENMRLLDEAYASARRSRAADRTR